MISFVNFDKLRFGLMEIGINIFIKVLVLLAFLNCIKDDFLSNNKVSKIIFNGLII